MAQMQDAEAASGIPGRFGCRRCGARWSGMKVEHCTMCHETFSSTAAGDLHRTGDHGVREGENRRRCLTPDEMTALRTKAGNPRLKLNARGIWTTWSDGSFWANREDCADCSGDCEVCGE